MKTYIIKNVSYAGRIKLIFLCVVGLALALFCGPVQAEREKDLLLIPSMKSDKASSSLLIDIAKAGDRFVAVGERGYILYSDDNCASWSQADVPVSVTLTAVDFPTAQKGWAAGHDGVVLHSADAGRTWEKQLDGWKINDMVITQLKQMIEDQGKKLELAVQEGKKKPSAVFNEKLEDIREDLQSLEYSLIGAEKALEEGPTRPLMNLWFKNDREGMVVGSYGLILKTTDGGKTWRSLMDRLENPDGLHLYGITQSGDDLFIAGEAGLLIRSDDMGNNWKRLESPYEGSFFGILGTPKGGAVIAFGLQGKIFYSHDRGENWTPARSNGFASLFGGACFQDGSFWIAGQDGFVMHSSDGGKTFERIPANFPMISSLCETGCGYVVLTGLGGTKRIERSMQAGK